MVITPGDLENLARCWACDRKIVGGTVHDLQVHYQYECRGAREKEEMEMGKKIRWTITGEGGPLDNRSQTWTLMCHLVEKAEELGLRVEVAELDEEER